MFIQRNERSNSLKYIDSVLVTFIGLYELYIKSYDHFLLFFKRVKYSVSSCKSPVIPLYNKPFL